MSGRGDLIDITCTVTGETEKAYRVDHGSTDDVWLPKSLCEYDENDNTMAMPEWLAKEKGMI